MLGKLLKQDFRATARIILPVYAAVPVLGLFTGLITRLCESQSNIWISILGSLVSFVFSLAVVLMILRFYRNLMTDEGYLMFTLPVSTTELICSKLIVSVVWFLGALAVDALGLLVTGRFGSYQNAVRFQVTYTFGMPMTGAQSAGLIIEFVAFLLLCCVALCLMTYAAMAIGQSFKKNKGLMSVVFFFVLWISTRMLLTLIFGLLFGLGAQPLPAMTAMPLLKSMYILLGCGCAGALAFCAGFFFLTHGMLRKHLNLQ